MFFIVISTRANSFSVFGALKKPRSDIPNLFSAGDNYHFNKGVAAVAYDLLVSKALGEVRDKSSESFFVVVVCAGWNAEPNATTSMK